jgi:uncharacterized protein
MVKVLEDREAARDAAERIRRGGGNLDFFIIGAVAFCASALTFFSGFGLGTLLLPAFALFLSAPAAVAATGLVHLLNGLFKGALVFRTAHWPTVLRFGIPAIAGAIIGALALSALDTRPAFRWSAFGRDFAPSAAGVLIGSVLIAFAALELTPGFQRLTVPPGLVPLGGAVTGFMGGLTGQQGAFRSMFLLKAGLDAPRFIATGVLVSILIDLARIPTYAASLSHDALTLAGRQGALIALGTSSAFLGAWLGNRYLQKATITTVRWIVAALMICVGAGLILGVLGT